MKTTWDELMQYAPEKDYAMPPLNADVQERILGKTMQKIEKKQRQQQISRFLQGFPFFQYLCRPCQLHGL